MRVHTNNVRKCPLLSIQYILRIGECCKVVKRYPFGNVTVWIRNAENLQHLNWDIAKKTGFLKFILSS